MGKVSARPYQLGLPMKLRNLTYGRRTNQLFHGEGLAEEDDICDNSILENFAFHSIIPKWVKLIPFMCDISRLVIYFNLRVGRTTIKSKFLIENYYE